LNICFHFREKKMARATEAQVRNWIEHVVARSAFASEDNPAVKAKLLVHDLLKQKFDAALFDETTLYALKEECKYFPDYSDVLRVFNRVTEQRRKERSGDATNLHFKAIAASLPSLPGERTDEEKAAVHATLDAYLAERKALADAQPGAARQKPKAYYLSDAQLLAEYGRVAGDERYTADQRAAAQLRVDMIHAKAQREAAGAWTSR
jgi:hypothetical protein